MHFTDQWVIFGCEMKQNHVGFQQFDLIWLPFFAVALMWCFFFLVCLFCLIYLFTPRSCWVSWMMEKGWSLRQNRKVAPVSSLEGFSFTFPLAEVCVSHCVLCFYANMWNQDGSVHPLAFSLRPLLLWNYKFSKNKRIISPANWDWSSGLTAPRDASSSSCW